MRSRVLALAASAAFAASCAEPVADIDRTQGNLIRKADLAGEWYVLQTVVGVPPTSGFTFVGETGRLERVRWEIQKDLLVAYRSYPLVPGAAAPSTSGPDTSRDNPIGAWPIEAHVDVLREYNSQTGEQSNVISENESDRQWYERSYVRVDWSANQVTNFDFIAPTRDVTNAAYFIPEEAGGPDAFYRETDTAGALKYFDYVGKLFVEPDIEACYYVWWGFGPGDCTSAEIQVRTSFSKVPEKSQYEPFQYDNHLMSRFGYFRSERFTYDEQRGVTQAGREYLINRHNIWKAAYREDGTVIPLAEREVKAVPYYLTPDFPKDPLLLEAARATMRQWDVSARKAVAALKGTDPEQVGTVFVTCQNPVAEDDPAECGAKGFSPRMGDLRYSALHWVDTHTVEGLLGYGPAATDPLTGEILSGKAHVYGAAVDTFATYAMDVIRFFNDEIDEAQLVRGEYYGDEILARLAGRRPEAKPDARTARVPISRKLGRPNHPARPTARREDLKPYDPQKVSRRIEAAREAGASPLLLNDEVRRALSAKAGGKWETLPPEVRDRFDPTRVLDPTRLALGRARRAAARARGMDMTDMIEPNIEGIVRKYQGRTDYDQLWRELRAEVFASTAEHEVGHTLGLRHNFQASYDSLNYPDAYWDLRSENLKRIETLGDLYESAELTPAQSEGMMRQHQYSSIMDYGYSWANDLVGLGKYDDAAIMFGYTAGTFTAGAAREPGLVEVFAKDSAALGDAGKLLTGTESGHTYDDPGLPSITLLERYHYTTVATSFPSLDDLKQRKIVKYSDFLKARDGDADGRMVRVPYLFCSDEWEGGLLSCHVFDQGADPFEMTKSKIDQYRSYYWFVNFRRGRVEFEIWDSLFVYFDRVFLPLSDYFQAWYLAPWGFDDAFDNNYQLAINAGFSLLGEVMSTPPYGAFCEGKNGRMVHLSDDPHIQGQFVGDESLCRPEGQRFNIAPGVGRRQFSRYDGDAGYLLEWEPLESGHYWATLAAVWAMTDPDAYVIGSEGDAGLYAISFYDWFPDEMDRLFGAMLNNEYGGFSPRAVIGHEDGRPDEALLKYSPAAPLWDGERYTDAETGEPVAGEDRAGPVGLCETCTSDNDCAGHDGRTSGTFCQPFADRTVCLVDCTNGPSSCPDGTECLDANCVPAGTSTCEDFAGDCDAEHPLGRCPGGQTCVRGTCEAAPWSPVVEAEPTFMLATDILWYGMLFTTSSYSTRFNDQLNVFRVGSPNEIVNDGDPTVERVEFTDPLRGVTWGAVQPRCDLDAPPTGETPICGACQVGQQCAGHTGRFGGVDCVAAAEGDLTRFCLQDCSRDADSCPDGQTCNDNGYCVPRDAGTCAPVAPRCSLMRPGDTGAVKLVRRGQELSVAYQNAMEAWYTYLGPDEALDDQLAREFFRTQYELSSHLDLLETVQATYNLFGRVY